MKQRGITLIALVITIIVLLLLAGISIAILIGENGILTKGNNAKEQTERQEVIENAKLKILEYETENEGKITDDKAYEIMAKYDKDYKENETFVFKIDEQDEEYFITKEGHKILVKEVWKTSNTIQFILDGYQLTAIKGETWKEWYQRSENRELVESLSEHSGNAFYVMKHSTDGRELAIQFGATEFVDIRKKGTSEIEQWDFVIQKGMRYVQFLDGKELEEAYGS